MAELIKTPFGAESTALEVIEGIDLSGKRAIVTGGSNGIGVETVRALASAGAEVLFTARDMEAGEKVAEDVKQTTGNDKVSVAKMDLSDWDSIDAFVKSWNGPLHLLVNNAGIMALPALQLAPSGYELQFATNHLGHFRLTLGLHDALKAAGTARVVSLSSRGHLRSPVVFDDINFEHRTYDPFLAYGQSKTANILFAVEITKRWASEGITANAVHPGVIRATKLSRSMDTEGRQRVLSFPASHEKTIPQGAATSVLVATSPQLEGIGGKYFEDCNEAPVVNPEPGGGTLAAGVAAYALDSANAERLWRLSLDVTGL